MDQKRFDWLIAGMDFDKLNDWETKFVESVEKQFKANGSLSPRQEEILERIFEEKQ